MSEADDAVIKGAGLAGFTLALQLFVYLRQTQGWTEQQENELLDFSSCSKTMSIRLCLSRGP
jgi:hypothetical protein